MIVTWWQRKQDIVSALPKETHIVSHLKGRSSSPSHSGVKLSSYLKAAAKPVQKVSVCEPVYSRGWKAVITLMYRITLIIF